MEDEDERDAVPDLREYGRALGRHRVLIAVTVAVVVIAAVGYSARQTRQYRATAQLIIQRADTFDSGPQNAQDAARNVDTETAVLRSKLVQEAARRKLGHQPDVAISGSQTSDVVNVSAKSSNAVRAANDANVYAKVYVALRRKQNIEDLAQAGRQVQVKIDQLVQRIDRLRAGSPELGAAQQQLTFLQQQLDQLQVSANLNQVAGARVLASADVPTSPVSPKPAQNAAIALVLGLLLAIGLAFLREYVDDTIKTREDLERATDGLPVLGEIPKVAGWRDREAAHLVTADAPHSPAAEGYRTLRTAIEFVLGERELTSIQVTSSQADDGKTTTLANVALAFARSGVKVTIVCCDLRRPRIHEFFGLSNEVGFTSVLIGRATLVDAVQEVVGEPNLFVLPSGPLPPNPSELLSLPRTDDIVASIEKNAGFGLLLVDCPPVLPVADALIVSRMVDSTVLVAAAGSSSRRGVRRSVQMLRQVAAPLVGTVLNNVTLTDGDGAYGYGYYGPGSDGSQGRRLTRKEKRAAR